MTAATKTNEIYPITTFICDLRVTLTTTAPPEAEAAPDSISARRLIIIGDVHGSRKSLEALLDAVEFDKAQGDEVIFVGDVVSKGRDSGGVIDLAGRLGARGVRGNHDDAVLRASRRRRLGAREGGQGGGRSGDEDDGEKSVSGRTAERLSASQLDFLASLPLVLRITVTPGLPGIERVVVVHAGLVPGVRLEEQSAYAVMHMRSLRAEEGGGFVPLEEAGEHGWMREWDAWQEECGGKTMVVFGHDAARGLQRGKYALGLDSRCVYGGKLSAWVVEAGEARVVQVDCVDEGGDG